jgi:DNA replication protein DnaC
MGETQSSWLDEYKKNTEPLVNYYEEKGLLKQVSCDKFESEITKVDILVLDDIGKEISRGNDLSVGTFDVVLRSRNHANRPTIITTNLGQSEFRGTYQVCARAVYI